MSSIGLPKQWWNALNQPNTLTSLKPDDEWNKEITAYVDQDEQAEKDRRQAAEDAKKAEADAKAKEEADLAAAAAAEAENMKRRNGMRKGMKATMITPSDQKALGSAPTQKTQLLG
jgi:membrane protein involved in colicin uptake